MTDVDNEEDMHRRIGWMVPADSAILRFLFVARDTAGRPSIQTPKTISANTGYSRKHVGNRCRHLEDHHLLEKVDRGEYRLSELGESLVNGGIKPEDLPNNLDENS